MTLLTLSLDWVIFASFELAGDNKQTQLQSSSAAVGDLASAGGNPIEISKAILEKDGIFGFWKGLRPTLIGIIPARSIYFFSYEQSKRFLGGAGLKEGEVSNALVSGFFAGKFESRRPFDLISPPGDLRGRHFKG